MLACNSQVKYEVNLNIPEENVDNLLIKNVLFVNFR